MLFLVNKTRPDLFDKIRIFGGDDDKAVLLVGDGAHYALAPFQARFEALDVESVYAAEDALEARGIDPAAGVETVDYDRMVDLILEDGEKVVAL